MTTEDTNTEQIIYLQFMTIQPKDPLNFQLGELASNEMLKNMFQNFTIIVTSAYPFQWQL